MEDFISWNILQIVNSFSVRLECQTVVSLLLTDLNDSRKRIAAKASINVFETTSLTQFYSSFPQSLRGQRSSFWTNLGVKETAHLPLS